MRPIGGYAAHRASRRVARVVRVAGLAALLTVGSLVAAPTAVSAAEQPAESLTVPVGAEPDRTKVTLDASVYGQPGGGRHPVVLLAHGFGGTKDSVALQARELQNRGYVVVTWTARGFGDSGGRIHLDDPNYEVADAKALLGLAAKRPDVQLDSPGDPRAGVMGASYGGALALLLAGTDPRIDGVVAAMTWNDLSQAFFPQAVLTGPLPTPAGRASIATPGPFKQDWASAFFMGAVSAGPASAGPTSSAAARKGAPAGACGRFDPTICRLFVETAQTGVPSDRLLTLLRAHSPAAVVDHVTAPTLLIQGMADSLFGLDQSDATARGLAAAGTPVAVRWSDGGHDAPSSREQEEQDASFGWLDHWVKAGSDPGSALPTPGFVYATASAKRNQPADLWSLPAYPGLAPASATAGASSPTTDPAQPAQPALPARSLPLASHGGAALRPPGGQPAAMVAVPGLSASGVSGSLSTYRLAALPGQSVALNTDPVREPITVVGSPTIRLSVTSNRPVVTLFASLWRVAGGQATLPHALVAPIRVPVTPGRPTPVTVSLPAATYPMPAGSSWRVLLTSTETSFTNDRTPAGVSVEAPPGPHGPGAPPPPRARAPPGGGGGVARGSGRAGGPDGTPIAGATRGVDTEDTIALTAIAVLLLAWLGTALVRRRRRTHEPTRPDLAEVPLVVEHLVKTYSDGHRAVDDVSWRAEKGQVVGLLGPNGAGKTTTMRMVMGLIRPDSGTVHVLGRPVTAGSSVLRRVGALIEGPGFLPHLTGRENLEAYWAATGMDPAGAHLAEAIDVAALGGALERPVKSYSHGMKQRLGIAQAMLGLPELLVLDEPTNGLDPPQIAAMRPILRRYAETGRTVVISSHLLAEVELTCTDVVVMHAGRVVTAGRVADLLDSADTTVLDLAEGLDRADVAGLCAELGRRTGITEVRIDTETRLVVVADLARDAVVRTAVDVGLPVVGVSSRRHLEEVFLGVIDSAAAANGSSQGADSGASLIERLRQVRSR
ncbi:MAG: alpha/beta fold hydrolase [Intrasporangium sp.]|uniref:alpha/beta fold hydrolase n=1 Tax=Intrasporangium sp. TaxID=1925024 RepID=UPI002649BB5A|nr:alpha/beta fold hydrolase [Intrasporangium sp.]MDN5795357.1 alpha/beta fold hydrolase [Intrasporangium sp.]